MQEQVQTLSQRESYNPSSFTRFLWWLATAERELIVDCSVDRNRYAITGFTVLATWLFATLAWTYFFTTVVNNAPTAAFLGIFMGGIILCIDRVLIKGINAQSKRKIGPFFVRGLLALTIGTFMAQPALLYLFDKEVHVQISLDNEQKKKDKRLQQDSLYALQKNELLQKKNLLQQQLDNKYKEVTVSRNAFIAESDGTGGSGRIGLKEIARAKENEYQKLDAEYQRLDVLIQPQIRSIDSSLKAIENAKQKEQLAFNTLLNDGFLTRIEALHHLVQNNSAAQFRYYLLIIILVLIELMPVIAKTFLPDGTYDEKVRLREAMEKEVVKGNIQKEKSLKELYNQLAFDQDSEFIHQFFEQSKQERREKMLEKLQQWRKKNDESFDSVWRNLKENFLTKQEN